MIVFEYKVVPAPERGQKTRATRSAPDRFASTLEALMNDLARDGWEYHRAETLPSEERSGLTGRTTVYRNLLIFRRPEQGDRMAEPPAVLADAAPQDTGADPVAADQPRRTEAARARSAGLRAVTPETSPPVAAPSAPLSAPVAATAEAAAAAAAAALRAVKPPEKKPAGDRPAGDKPSLANLMAEKRATRPAK